MPAPTNDRLLRAARLEPVDCTPVWFMRQAGRSLPRYHELKGDRDLLEVTRDPRLAADITMLPLEYFPVDGAVLYADISTIFIGAGIDVRIEKGLGPVLPHPYNDAATIASLRPFDPRDRLDFVMETLQILRAELDIPVLGFLGAPFTLMTYMVESPRTRDRAGTKAFMWREPQLWDDLMSYWSEHLIEFGKAQVEAGASVIQLFDSWAGALHPDDYERSVLPYSARILEGLEDAGIPTINFATGNPALLPMMAESGGKVIGLDWRVRLDEAWEIVGHDRGVQGNLDPIVLTTDPDTAIARADEILKAAAGRPGHIFNVGHGLTPDAKPEVVRAVVDHVHQATRR
ncbi:MAG: uroporphyrinogen decarboxylase [Gemmatimonadales bacterium]|nr:MAG: uroporphyrinogen decarboxylase [Gemmatimonadales bacterium]